MNERTNKGIEEILVKLKLNPDLVLHLRFYSLDTHTIKLNL